MPGTKNIIQDLEARGLIADKTADLARIFSEPRTVYWGIDPTADSLHVGHLVPLLMMKRLGLAGHTLIFLVGGATGMIGDPKEKGERSLLEEEVVEGNVRAIKKQVRTLIGTLPFRLVNNIAWLSRASLIPFLRDVGKYFTVNELIKRETIRRRLETPDESISYTEFTYALLQGYDYFVLNKKYNCTLQIGASDQWTNILSGVELIRRRAGKEVFGLTVPLVTDAAGKKFGKSEGNAVWLDARKTSPFAFYQFWLNQPDSVLGSYLRLYTFLSSKEIDALLEMHHANPAKHRAQQVLAHTVTEIAHGASAAASAEAAAEALFGRAPLSSLSRSARAALQAEAPHILVRKRTTIMDTLLKGGFASSKSDARRLIAGGAVFLNGIQVGEDRVFGKDDFTDGLALLKKGKHDVLLLVLK